MKRSSFRARIVRRVAGVDSRENEATRGRQGEENERVEVKECRRDGTDGVFHALRQRRQLKPGSREHVQAPECCASALPPGSSPRLRYRSGPLTLKQPLLTLEARSGRGKNVS